MVWINVHNDDLSEFYYSDLGMDEPRAVTDNRKAQVSADVAEELYEQYPDDFSSADVDDADGDGDADAVDEETDTEDEI